MKKGVELMYEPHVRVTRQPPTDRFARSVMWLVLLVTITRLGVEVRRKKEKILIGGIRKADLGLQASDFRPRTSDLGLRTSDLRPNAFAEVRGPRSKVRF